ncbi:MAG: DUF2027 domain-containing protein [Paludibacter sp.]|nr:DUF2027 domain-containing protein [Paludibacter sp.]
MIKKGDTVRFLNAVGGGVVTRVDEIKKMLYVEDADGFEIPVLEKECVMVGAVNKETNFPKRDFSSKTEHTVAEKQIVEVDTKKPEQETRSYEQIIETVEGETLKAFLAFFPQDIKQLQTTSYDCYLVNDSNYFLYYNIIYGENNNRKSLSNGLIEPNMQEEITQISKDELNSWENLRVQIIPFKKNKIYTPQNVLDVQLKINVVKFYKLHSFTENDYFDDLAMIIDIVSEKENQKLADISPLEIKNAMLHKEEIKRPRITLRQQVPDVIEVDLHINELVDTTAGMGNADMLQLQLTKFHAVLNENKSRKGQKIVFIHGKGEGVLRNEIEKLLKSRYKTYYFQDASFREYGFGATMVTIK